MWVTNFDEIVCDNITAATSTITTETIQDLTATWNTIIWNSATDTATLNWVVSLANKVVLSGLETIAAGWTTTALSLTVSRHDIDSDVGGDIFTLANWVDGQLMIIVNKSATGTSTVTPATFLSGTSVTMATAGASVQLMYQTTNWWSVIGWNAFTVI